MNRLAVVLAADSATTVSGWVNGQREERYFKGANKIFQLSNAEPVGVMIYDSAEILRVPWELVIKSFRSRLGTTAFDDISGYAEAFFRFIQDDVKIFPLSVRISTIRDASIQTCLAWIGEFSKNGTNDFSIEDTNNFIDQQLASLENIQFYDGISKDLVDEIYNATYEKLVSEISDFLAYIGKPGSVDLYRLAQAGLLFSIKNPEKAFNTTGIVFAGYPNDSIFPTMVEYKFYGVVGSISLFKQTRKEIIDHDTPASISSFAQTSMIDTFSTGLGFEMYAAIMNVIGSRLDGLADQILGALGVEVSSFDQKAQLVQAASQGISDLILDHVRNNHSIPLWRVIGSLPVDEMAGLAETLITLQSLKEKVTKPSESVGGPVDVAAITRTEGLVWIKRKHFFDPSLNTRYMLRQAMLHPRP